MQPEKKEIDKSVSEQLIEEENNDEYKRVEKLNQFATSVMALIKEHDINVGDWGLLVEEISNLISQEVSLLKLNTIIKK